MKLFASFLLSVIILTGYSQQSRTKPLIPVTRGNSTSITKSLEAKFTANLTQGTAPLTVQFTDQSTGNPSSWKWTFGDGDSSMVQNPEHIYQSAGTYTVKLTISDGTNGFALEKKDYIRVSQNYTECDTLRYPLPEPLTYYIIKDEGYVTGNNSYGDKVISEFYDTIPANLVITGMLCEFSKAKQVAGNNEKIGVKVWSAGILSGKPATLLSSDTIKLSALVNDVANNKATSLDFANPVQPGGAFYMGIQLPALTGDTLCLWSTSSGKLPVNTTWVLQSNDVWESAQALWSPQGGPAFIISCALYPKICLLNGVDKSVSPLAFAIWPNPAHNYITIVNQQAMYEQAEYTIFDIAGKKLLQGKISDSLLTNADVSSLKPGMYIIHINGKHSVFSTRLIIK